MSAFVVADAPGLTREEMVEALEAAYGKGNVEVHDTPTNLYGYTGDRRQDVAHLIVRRDHVGQASNDLGIFIDPATGVGKVIISEYDRRCGQGGKVDRALAKVKTESGLRRQEEARAAISAKAARIGYKVRESRTPAGEVRLVLVKS